MKKPYRSLSFLCFILCIQFVHAQDSSLKVMAEVPVQFGLGYEGKISKRFSVGVSAGLLTSPNSNLIINVLKVLGTDEEVVVMIKDAFKFGVVGELNLNYNFNRNYIGAFGQVIGLHGGDAPTAVVEDYFGTSINSYPTKRGRPQTAEKYLTISSTLYQAGLLYGRRFPFKDKRFEVNAEFGLSANVGSTSKITSENRDLSALSKVANTELATYYKEYAFVPSLTVAFVYKLRRPN